MDLNSSQRSYLIKHSHDLNPVVHVGKNGINNGVLDQTEQTLDDHELIKVRINDNAPLAARESAEKISEETGAAVVQVIGSVVILYRENPELDGYDLPE